ncbi:hypothetical protein EVAR_15738_1 [Eumeta japonica]|uniref:Uncharacterized protein n=1 Tax=Eumeta variegata TaxID=151549 RepID=A0A4C1Z5A0_EUMVA|nr:hypothetical protein EVAR_15738_1 [Eumeta japonica]
MESFEWDRNQEQYRVHEVRRKKRVNTDTVASEWRERRGFNSLITLGTAVADGRSPARAAAGYNDIHLNIQRRTAGPFT